MAASNSRLKDLVQRIRRRAVALRHRNASTDAAFRPTRAGNVRLIGPMTDSAFARQPWLVERGDKFIQLTELLYSITQLADGTRSIEQIASETSAHVGSEVPADFVRQMIETRLVPVGLISGQVARGAPQLTATHSASGSSRSPLALSMRMAVIRPAFIGAFTRILQHLYAPPVLLLLLLVIVQSQYWLLFVHGVAAGVSQALTSPGIVPLAVGLVVCSAAFHELGHAAALRYGGGQVRGMGVGLYLMYPAFYTDVTDNYRLGRWARVRTDLGGFYFNLLFSLGLMGVYHLTGQEFLLVVALLTDIEIIHQCLPFVRLDGYWALADLTGIPDFFSFMGAYVRSIVPGLGLRGRKLPELKWWAKAVFGLYILITLPLLAVLLFAMLKSAPRVVVTALAAAQQQIGDIARAQGDGDLLATAGSEGQLLLLLLPAVGLCVMLLSLARTFALLLWRWGRPGRGRRFVSAVVGAGLGALLLFLWLPGLADLGTYAAVLNRFRAPLDAAAATPISPEDVGTIPQAVAAMPDVFRHTTTPTPIPVTPTSTSSVPEGGAPIASTPRTDDAASSPTAADSTRASASNTGGGAGRNATGRANTSATAPATHDTPDAVRATTPATHDTPDAVRAPAPPPSATIHIPPAATAAPAPGTAPPLPSSTAPAPAPTSIAAPPTAAPPAPPTASAPAPPTASLASPTSVPQVSSPTAQPRPATPAMSATPTPAPKATSVTQPASPTPGATATTTQPTPSSSPAVSPVPVPSPSATH